MERPEATIHSFVVHIWIEEAASDEAPALWRGSIIHVLDKEKISFSNLGQLVAFLKTYLQKMGAEVEAQP